MPLSSGSSSQLVTVDNFTRAETDTYFAQLVHEGELGRFAHNRDLASVEHQTVVRMNRDTLYSWAVFDLDAGPVTITLPASDGRFMSLLLIDEDHYNPATIYEAGSHTISKAQVGTRYVAALVRAFVDPGNADDLAQVHKLQDAIKVEQPGGPGIFDIPQWDQTSLQVVRNGLKSLGAFNATRMFGKREDVDPIHHLIGTAVGWGGNPEADAKYLGVIPQMNDGTTVYRLTVRDVPVDGFWSVSVYNEDGFFEPNAQGAYALNNVTAAEQHGSYTIQFGGCEAGQSNCLPITPGWSYTVRLYRPRAEILDGSWTFPEAKPVA